MATLTEISIASRKYVLYLIAVFIGYLILSFLFNLIKSSLTTNRPIPVPPPNVRFNKIPAPKFPQAATSSSGLQFELLNIEGRPPETTTAAKIYAMPKKQPSLLTIQKANSFAVQLDFIKEPEVITPLYFRYTDPKDPLRTLELDAVNLNFKLKYDYLKNLKAVSSIPISNKNQPQKDVINYIQKRGFFDDGILKGKITSEYFTFDSNSLSISKASSIATTNMVRINFFRENINDMKVVPSGFYRSNTYILYTPSPDVDTSILEVIYSYWPVAFDDFATYPLKSGASAWQELNNGYAYVINPGTNPPDKPIVVREIYLSYYDSEEPQTYLQPIFVFEGDNDFAAYLPAISPEWLE